jgi:hypothetical protein
MSIILASAVAFVAGIFVGYLIGITRVPKIKVEPRENLEFRGNKDNKSQRMSAIPLGNGFIQQVNYVNIHGTLYEV